MPSSDHPHPFWSPRPNSISRSLIRKPSFHVDRARAGGRRDSDRHRSHTHRSPSIGTLRQLPGPCPWSTPLTSISRFLGPARRWVLARCAPTLAVYGTHTPTCAHHDAPTRAHPHVAQGGVARDAPQSLHSMQCVEDVERVGGREGGRERGHSPPEPDPPSTRRACLGCMLSCAPHLYTPPPLLLLQTAREKPAERRRDAPTPQAPTRQAPGSRPWCSAPSTYM